ncbi:hypothetical protein R1sor_026249 [Riccia sorocarpa]|uniref:Uncharacterized protein n=1 Tax=Riccia sorocarpa TaxID=122646 RepID=A0ABD3GEI8_9MARC
MRTQRAFWTAGTPDLDRDMSAYQSEYCLSICESSSGSGEQKFQLSFTLDDSFPVDSYFTADVDGEIATAARIVTYTPTLDEAIYRSTWKFQALLDKNNVSIELQESILASVRTGCSPDATGWTNGLQGYESGIVTALCWPYAHRPSTGLQRDCEICTERCAATSCRLQRKNMESFDYILIGSIRLFRSRTYCHSMLSMWRAKHRWFMPDETAVNVVLTFPIKDLWDGTKTKEISWFWDSGKTWELPVVCAACQDVYQAFPAKCQMLITNFNVNTKTYNFICESCGTRVISEAKFTHVNYLSSEPMHYIYNSIMV